MLSDCAQSFVLFSQIVTEEFNVTFFICQKVHNDKNAIESCARSGPENVRKNI